MMLFWPPPPSRPVVPPFWTCTPGVKAVKVAKLRLTPTGRFCTASVAMVKDRSPLCDWISGLSARTSTVSEVPPTWIESGGIATRSPALRATPLRRRVLNPSIVTSTVYVSGVTFGNAYVPFSPVTTGASLVPLVSLIKVTVAPGTTAPCASSTVPEMFPVVICAAAGAPSTADISTAAITRHGDLGSTMLLLLWADAPARCRMRLLG